MSLSNQGPARLIIAFIFFTILTILFTFPLILHMGSSIPAFVDTTEPYATIWWISWHRYAFTHHIPYTHIATLAFPFGFDQNRFFLFPTCHAAAKWIAVISNEIFAYNLIGLVSFILAGLFTVQLVYYLTGNLFVSIFSGIIYSFCPYHFVRLWQHFAAAQIQWTPLYLYCLFKLRDNPRLKYSIFTGLAFSLLILSDSYIAFYMSIITFVFWVCVRFYYRDKQLFVKFTSQLFLSVIVALVIVLPDHLSILKDMLARKNAAPHAWSVASRPFEDLFPQSARPLSYLVPSTEHPLFGAFTQGLIGSPLYGENYTEHTLYLGWIPLLLAFFAIRRWRNLRKVQKDSGRDFAFYFFIWMAVVSWLCSQPPWWQLGRIRIFMPTYFLYKVMPMIRAYARFGIILEMAVAVLAGFGLLFILNKRKTFRGRMAMVSLFSLLVLFEFFNWPPTHVIDLSRPPAVYLWLKEKPAHTVVAEYPLETSSPNPFYMFYQTIHQKPLVNCAIPNTRAHRIAQVIADLSGDQTPGILRGLGVNLVIVHTQAYRESGLVKRLEELEAVRKHPGLRFQQSFADDEVYAVTAEPLDPKIQ